MSQGLGQARTNLPSLPRIIPGSLGKHIEGSFNCGLQLVPFKGDASCVVTDNVVASPIPTNGAQSAAPLSILLDKAIGSEDQLSAGLAATSATTSSTNLQLYRLML